MIIGIVALLTGACAKTAPESIPPGDFEDTTWVLESYGEPGNLQAVLEGSEITAIFDGAEGRVHGSAGCNNYFGSYEVEGNRLTLPGPIGSTRMSCGEQIDKQEYEYLSTLEAAESYQIQEGKLQIDCGNQVLIFSELLPGDFEDTKWKLESYGEVGNLQAVVEGSQITATFDSAEGRVHGSAGCNTYFGRYQVSGIELSILETANTEMYCMEPEGVMDQEQQYLKLLQAAESYQIQDGKLQINSGNQVLVFGKLP